jgi:hypothetical protein
MSAPEGPLWLFFGISLALMVKLLLPGVKTEIIPIITSSWEEGEVPRAILGAILAVGSFVPVVAFVYILFSILFFRIYANDDGLYWKVFVSWQKIPWSMVRDCYWTKSPIAKNLSISTLVIETESKDFVLQSGVWLNLNKLYEFIKYKQENNNKLDNAMIS